jgi:hypothetical protein
MKANEAPEKIYIHVRANKELGTTWHGKKITNSDIEYVRKDAFIEKVAKWINEHTSLSEKLVVENFIKYMEGE